MAVTSMTGFARSDGNAGLLRWTWELRSVNGKGLDIRLRLPPGYERLEAPSRERIAARLARGNVQASLMIAADAIGQQIRINQSALASVLAALDAIKLRAPDAQPPTLDGILAVRGVVEIDDAVADEETQAAADAAVLGGLDDAVTGLLAVRGREGAALKAILDGRLHEIERLVGRAETSPARTVDAIRAKLAEQISLLLDAAPTLDPDRLHQEAVLLAARADIREELDRLTAHVAAARALLDEGGAIGRRLDFLAQEFNREVNTLCAKANDRALTAIGLELKASVDQMREQVQNLE